MLKATGHVLADGPTLAAIHVEIASDDGRFATVAAVDADGSFPLQVPRAGKYAISIRATSFLDSTFRICEVSDSHSRCEIVLPPTAVRFRVLDESGDPVRSGAQIEILGPMSPLRSDGAGVLNGTETGNALLLGLEYGEFVITARSSDGRTSESPLRVSLSPAHPAAHGDLVLRRRPLSIAVRTEHGEFLKDAAVRPMKRTLQGSGGTFDATTVPDGQEMQVTAPGFIPSCFVADGRSGQQTVVLRPLGTERVLVRLSNGTRAGGLLSGIEGSQCLVSASGFVIDPGDAVAAGEIAFWIVGLTRGRYQYQFSKATPAVGLTAPGPATVYEVPTGCVICGQG
jgi:hypothetical protein